MIKVISIETKFGWISAFEKKGKIYRVKFGKHKNRSTSKNLKNFKAIIDFDNYSTDINNFLKQFNIENKEEIHENKSKYNSVSNNEAEVIKIYNYWDIKLYNEILNKKIPLE